MNTFVAITGFELDSTSNTSTGSTGLSVLAPPSRATSNNGSASSILRSPTSLLSSLLKSQSCELSNPTTSMAQQDGFDSQGSSDYDDSDSEREEEGGQRVIQGPGEPRVISTPVFACTQPMSIPTTTYFKDERMVAERLKLQHQRQQYRAQLEAHAAQQQALVRQAEQLQLQQQHAR